MNHLTSVDDLSVDNINSILEKSHFYSQKVQKQEKIEPILNQKVVSNIFFENSTRTKFSFEVAQKRLGAIVLDFNEVSSSMAKGETLLDTLKTFEALGTQIAVIRHSDDNFILSLKDQISFSIVNAGAGKREHPSQALLDLFTIKQHFKNLSGLNILICGDINNSRVASSHIKLLNKMGVNLYFSGPESLMPPANTQLYQLSEIDQCIDKMDVVMMLRIQHERHQTFELKTHEYNRDFGLNHQRVSLMKKSAIIMHPGPFNRGIEIESDLVSHPQSVIFKQMQNGVYTRMGILDWLVNN